MRSRSRLPAVLAAASISLGLGGCSLVQTLQMPNATPQQRTTVYAVMGTFVVMAVLATAIAGAPSEQPAGMGETPGPGGVQPPGR